MRHSYEQDIDTGARLDFLIGTKQMGNESAGFRALLERMSQAICRGDGAAAATCFVRDGIHHDGFYGEFHGRAAIRDMMKNRFHANATCSAGICSMCWTSP